MFQSDWEEQQSLNLSCPGSGHSPRLPTILGTVSFRQQFLVWNPQTGGRVKEL